MTEPEAPVVWVVEPVHEPEPETVKVTTVPLCGVSSEVKPLQPQSWKTRALTEVEASGTTSKKYTAVSRFSPPNVTSMAPVLAKASALPEKLENGMM